MNAGYLATKRFGLGARPGDVARLSADPRGQLMAALQPDSNISAPVPGFTDIPSMVHAGRAWISKRKEMLAKDTSDDAIKNVRRAIGRNLYIRTYENAAIARASHAISTDQPFVERLVQYWSNHFAVSAGKGGALRALAGHYEDNAIRPHVLGNFRDMLHAVVKHPMMIGYLDNRRSIGPNSRIGRKTGKGLNENLAREILELHTLGVNGGYLQTDVTNFARILTGWTIYGPKSPDAYTFWFRKRIHEPGTWTVLGRKFGDHGLAQGEAVLDMLAAHPATAKYVATRFCKHFVSSNPPPTLVARLERTFLETRGDLAELARALVSSDEAWQAERPKLLPPYDFFVAAYRATGAQVEARFFLRTLNNMGQPVWAPPSPEGWPEEDDAWMTPSALVERLDIANTIARRTRLAGSVPSWVQDILGDSLNQNTMLTLQRAESKQQAIALALMTAEFQRR